MLEHLKANQSYLGDNLVDETIGNQQRSLRERIAWLAGIIDGEGCFDIGKVNSPYNGVRVHRRVFPSTRMGLDITNTDGRILDECISVFKELGLPFHIAEKTDKRKGVNGSQYKKCFKLTVYGIKRLCRVLPCVIPYLVGKRQQAEAMLKLAISRSSKNQGFTWTEEEYALAVSIRTMNNSQKLPETTMVQPFSVQG